MNGGETGIRTQERVAPLSVFKTDALRPMLSTAQPSLREQGFIIINIYFKNKMT